MAENEITLNQIAVMIEKVGGDVKTVARSFAGARIKSKPGQSTSSYAIK